LQSQFYIETNSFEEVDDIDLWHYNSYNPIITPGKEGSRIEIS